MAQIIGLPKLSPTMEEGVLVKWNVAEGDSVEPGDLVAEVETDKANMDFNIEDEGVVLKLLVAEGESVLLGAPVAILGEAGEDITELVAQAAAQASTPASAPAPAPVNAPPAPAPAPAAASAPAPAPVPAAAPAARPSPPAGARVLASPLAKTLAIDLGIDLRTLSGSGPGGRIIERDVRAASAGAAPEAGVTPPRELSSGPTSLAITSSSTELAQPLGDYIDEPLSGVRRTIAERLTAAKQQIPHYRLTADFDATPLKAFRARLNALLDGRGKVTINDLIIKACALALRRVPGVNASFLGDAIRTHKRVHIGVAVALERGLLTPVVRDADLKGIGVIGAEVKDLVGRARERRIKLEEIQGSTFTVSNLGMFRVNHFDAIINPPEAAILAVGRIREMPVAVGGKLEVGERMNLTLSCDHRVVDGALGARFLDSLIDLLEGPEALAL